jgi:amino acid transporter
MQPGPQTQPQLIRRFGLVQSTALNMSNMIGIGPFITIPLLLSTLGGPQAMLGWLIALVIAIADGMIWSELGAALPGSGGTYHYLREAFGRQTWGRLMAFLFIWQFTISGPLEIASGYIGFSKYARYLWPGLTPETGRYVAMAIGLVNILLVYREITALGKITLTLWVGMLITVASVLIAGATHFNPAIAFDFPPGAFNFSVGFLFGLGAAARIGIYDYLGYYDICYIGDEVREPGKVIPRSILISVISVAAIYIAINLSITGVLPWHEFVPADAHPQSDFIVSVFMERIYGQSAAKFFTVLVLWTTVASVFALLVGYSRIPYAAAKDGSFFKIFGRLHPRGKFPHISVLLIGSIAMICCLFSLDIVIEALITTRILIQFIGQIVAVSVLRATAPNLSRPFRIWLYPLPNLVALLGWIFIFATTDKKVILFGIALLLLGVIGFLAWAKRNRHWPFAEVPAAS